MATHEVLNQPPPLIDYDLAGTDPVLIDATAGEGGGWGTDEIVEFGRKMASGEVIEWGYLANRHPPVLHTHDRYGNRADRVEFHPAWHSLLELTLSHGLHSLPWEKEPGDGGYPVRTALTYLAGQIEAGHWCPVSMSCSAVPTLRAQPEIGSEWEPMVLSRDYDPAFEPASKKAGVLMGMGMTEKQGGSDVRANTTRALPLDGGGPGAEYEITGHKWFLSAPMSDAFLVLAQAPGGLSCFLLPRFTPDGSVNQIRLQRLKDKLGNRSNASAEVEFEAAWARLLGEEGRGVATIIDMVAGTRLDCIAGSAALMRQAVTQALHHTRHRTAFGSPLIEKPLMQNVFADMEVEVEAATLLMMRVAGAFDRAEVDEREAAIKRLLTPVAKYWATKRCSELVREAMECLGGNGYVEESMMPRLYRESPLNAIWEGSGNVIALDVVRALARERDALDALRQEVSFSSGHDSALDQTADHAFALAASPVDPEYQARQIVEGLALAVSGALVARYGSQAVYEAFSASRLKGSAGRLYGTLPGGLDLDAIIEPATPV